ncbi:MAG: ABC transporter ATP-binding protein [Christensenellales bacterium]
MKLVMKTLKPYRWALVITVLATLLNTLSELLLPNIMSNIVDKGVVNGDIAYIWAQGGLMLLVALGAAGCAVAGSYFSSRLSTGFGRDLRREIFHKVDGYSLTEMDQIGTPSLITRTTNDVNQVQMAVMICTRMMLMAPLMLVGSVIMALGTDRALSWVIVVVVPLIALVVALLITKALPLFTAMQKKIDKLNQVVRENLTGVKVIRAFIRTDYEHGRFEGANNDLFQTALKSQRIMTGMMPLMMLLLNFTTIAIVWFGAKRIDLGQMQVGALMAFIQYATQILMSVMMASMLFVLIPRASVSVKRIQEVLGQSGSLQDPAEPVSPDPARKGYLTFDHVSFCYPGSGEPVLQDIDFEAGPGEVTAIIGSTGSGKSTLANLIPRFYDVSQGAVRIDGVDVRDMTQQDVRSRLGFVPQRAFLFSGTVATNLRDGQPDATEEELWHALDVAQATEFVSQMPEGLEHPIAQGGGNVSGGQKQRLAIARALVRRPEIYVFDDSFSALDFKTDAMLRAALKRETQNATVVLIAQRVGTVMDADRILVLDEGRVAGLGTHRELMATCPVYQEIVRSQLSEEELA